MNGNRNTSWQSHPVVLFAAVWSLLFCLYLPAARCGWVSDTLGWLEAIRSQPFPDYVNRAHFGIRSLYQTTQIVTWAIYEVIGASQWAWHIIHLTLHALNCTLLYLLCRRLLRDSGVSHSALIAFTTAILFCTSPYVSEVIVWEASFHFLQGLCFILIQLLLLLGYLHRPRPLPAIAAAVLYVAAAFSLEVFYLTPLFSASVLLYYRFGLNHDRAIIRQGMLRFLLPQVAVALLHITMVPIVTGTATARLGNDLLHMPLTYFAVKPPDYFFHLLGGRFLPQSWRSAVHSAFCTYAGAGAFYLAMLSASAFTLLRLRKLTPKGLLFSIYALWMLFGMLIVLPMWFPERLLITGDRYLYFMLPFFLAMLAMLSRQRKWGKMIIGSIILLQCGGTVYLNLIWRDAQRRTDALQQNIPVQPGRINLYLNNPQSLRGAPMIGAGGDAELILMHNLLYPEPAIRAEAADVLACDLTGCADSVTVQWVGERVLSVRLHRPGARWWYNADYARPHSTNTFSVALPDAHIYLLTLWYAADRYAIHYQQDGTWQTMVPPATASHTAE